MAPRRKLEKLYPGRYAEANDCLAAAREQQNLSEFQHAGDKFLELLEDPGLPIWMRAQCNTLVAGMITDTNFAREYLKNAQTRLETLLQSRETLSVAEKGACCSNERARAGQARELHRRKRDLDNDEVMLLGCEKEALSPSLQDRRSAPDLVCG
ncbi:hypothetical protein CERZMDRAFT_84552 [Cercospora zeae-maydis SCOH1-5]|uniref:Uncharacterized protein n=1 Tax=Cercospora zeae-maydis SCOH1-5 TaxID=717836 RepID=A0A6A6FFE6_9PEZI|nr:hypothetical protein CERZMDRAFT_84552 [Cercospora zeae-maydis SCOH1-5]